MADKPLQSKVKLRSGEVLTITHKQPSKQTTDTSKNDPKDNSGDKTKTPENDKSNKEPKETK